MLRLQFFNFSFFFFTKFCREESFFFFLIFWARRIYSQQTQHADCTVNPKHIQSWSISFLDDLCNSCKVETILVKYEVLERSLNIQGVSSNWVQWNISCVEASEEKNVYTKAVQYKKVSHVVLTMFSFVQWWRILQGQLDFSDTIHFLTTTAGLDINPMIWIL